MASLKFPLNVSSVTFASSGVKAPDASGIVTGLTPAEVTSILYKGAAKAVSTASNGNISISLPTDITAITINSIAYNVNGSNTAWGKLLSAAVPAPAATSFLYQNITLVQG